MRILVINSGSSSIKYKFFDNNFEIYQGKEEEVKEYESALENVFKNLIDNKIIKSISDIDAVGHRIVHGGEKFCRPVVINNEVIKTIKELIPLAPLHNPINLKAIEFIHKNYPNIAQVGVFDTAFHQSMPKKNYIYPVRKDLYEKYHVRKYGFHGTSHEYVSKKTAKFLKKEINQCNFITLHLGNGDSACAIKNGKSYNTSMGFTPLDGLMMGTRCGAIDPEIILYLNQQLHIKMSEIDNILNKQSGFKGLCGKSDLREVYQEAKNKNKDAILALEIFIQKIKEYIGSYFIQLQKVDAIIFTGGIGEHSAFVRQKVCKELKCIGAIIDKKKNKTFNNDITLISSSKSKIKIVVAATDEERAIAIKTKELLC